MAKKKWNGAVMGLLLAVLSISGGVAWGSEFPNRAIEFVVPYAPGGPSDATARSLAPKMNEVLGQPVVVVNKPSGAGVVALTLLAKSKPDGYSIVFASSSALSVVPHLQKVEYDPLSDFTYLGYVIDQNPMLVVKSHSPWKTAEEFFEYARKNPRKVKYGTYGQNSGAHIAMEAIGKELGIEWGHIPFKGDGPCVTALLGGHIDAAATAAGHVPQLRAGTFRGLLMLQSYRSRVFVDVSSMRDVGIKFEAKGSTEAGSGVIGPKGLPKEVIKKYENAIKQAFQSPEFLRSCETLGLDYRFMASEEFYHWSAEGYRAVGDVMKKLGFK